MCSKCDCNTAKAAKTEDRIPFDLEAAKRGEPIVTRDRREAEFVAYVVQLQSTQKFLATVNGLLMDFSDNGRFYPSNNASDADLFMAPKPKPKKSTQRIAVLNASGSWDSYANTPSNRQRARDELARGTIIASKIVTITEGERHE